MKSLTLNSISVSKELANYFLREKRVKRLTKSFYSNKKYAARTSIYMASPKTRLYCTQTIFILH